MPVLIHIGIQSPVHCKLNLSQAQRHAITVQVKEENKDLPGHNFIIHFHYAVRITSTGAAIMKKTQTQAIVNVSYTYLIMQPHCVHMPIALHGIKTPQTPSCAIAFNHCAATVSMLKTIHRLSE